MPLTPQRPRGIDPVNSTDILPNPPIVIVEDDKGVRNALRFRMELEGWPVIDYASAEDLLEEASLPDRGCLVLDQILPGLSGLDLLSRLRAGGVGLPAIVITTYPSAAVRARAAKDAVEIVEKPLFNDALIEAVRGVLANQA